MKRLALLMLSGLVISCTTSLVPADAPQMRGREVIDLKMGGMVLPFKHWKHQTTVHNDCFNCHKTRIGKIDDWGKETAHNTCIPCHYLESRGPTECDQCHKKISSKSSYNNL